MKDFLKRSWRLVVAAVVVAISFAAVAFGRRPRVRVDEPAPIPPPPSTPPVDTTLTNPTPSTTYQAEKVAPAASPSAVISRLNERHK